MRIGILTINGHYNYGNRLQNFALQTLLQDLVPNICIETVWHTQNNYALHRKLPIFELKNIRRYLFNRHGYRDEFNSNLWMHDYIREYNIKKFSDRYLNIKYDYCVKKDLNDRYDYFIVGSDQVWNPQWLNSNDVFLEFASPNKRIAYAASVGVSEIPKGKEAFFKKGFDGMAHISVREHAGAEIINELTGKQVPVVLDPTLTLTGEQWAEIIQRPAWYKDEKYIMVFFLSKLPDLVRTEIERIAKENDLEIIDLMDKSKIDYYTSSPEEFLYLIKNASLVYTDSFHCTVFSILYKTAFVNCSRENMGMNMDSRMDTLLGMFGFENRKAEKSKGYTIHNPLDMNWKDVEKVLEPERLKARKYLLNALGLNS